MPKYDQKFNIDNTTLINTGGGIVGVNPDNLILTNKQDRIDNNLTTTDKTIVGAINENKDSINNLRITQNFTLTYNNILKGSVTNDIMVLIKGNLQFKKGNNIYSMGSIGETSLVSREWQCFWLGTTWHAYLDTASSTTLGTNITATYTNGTKLISTIEGFTVTFPNTNTIIVTCRDNTTTPCTISFDISGLA